MSDTNDSLESLGLLLEVGDVASWLNLDGQDPDIWLESAVVAANGAVLDWLGLDPRSQSTIEVLDGTGGCTLMVNRYPITAVTQVTFLSSSSGGAFGSGLTSGGNAQNVANFTFDQKAPVIINRNGSFPRGRSNIQITYTAGYTAIPEPIKLGIKYTIKAMLDATGVDFNATGENYSGVLSQQFWPSGPGAVPPSAQSIMQRYQKTI